MHTCAYVYKCLAGLAVELHHRLTSSIQIVYLHAVKFMGCSNQTCAKWFAENQDIAWLSATLRQNVLWMYDACDREAILGFLISHSMSASDHCSCLCNGIRGTAQNLTEQSRFQVIRP